MRRCSNGEGLVLLAAVTAFQLACGRGDDQLGLLAAFFTLLGDSLAMIAAARDACPEPEPCEPPEAPAGTKEENAAAARAPPKKNGAQEKQAPR